MIQVNIEKQFNPSAHPVPTLQKTEFMWTGSFQAMASDCQVLLEGVNQALATKLLERAAKETWRIEHKFSRYRQDNIIHQINNAAGTATKVDDETAGLLNFADQCFQLSDGLFDISSGGLGKIWRFNGSDQIPSNDQIQSVLKYVGWNKSNWQAPYLTIREGMELDLGGIGKEYAVDKVIKLLSDVCTTENNTDAAILVNFGGDLACSGPRQKGHAWEIAVESSEKDNAVSALVKLSHGAVATSGDARRFLLKDGVRYSHILNPLTGHSVISAPRAISVAASNCMQAGMLSTLAMLQGEHAEDFLDAQGVQYWVQR